MQNYKDTTSITNFLFDKLEKVNMLLLVERLFYLSINLDSQERINFFNQDAIDLGRTLMPYINAKYEQKDTDKAKAALSYMVFKHHSLESLCKVAIHLNQISTNRNECITVESLCLYQFTIAVNESLEFAKTESKEPNIRA